MSTIRELQNKIEAWGKEKGWNEGQDPEAIFPAKIALMHTELSEALEEFRNGHPLNEVRVEDGKPEGVGIELADCVIRILHMAALAGIDLDACIQQKLEYNNTRPYKHGGKKI